MIVSKVARNSGPVQLLQPAESDITKADTVSQLPEEWFGFKSKSNSATVSWHPTSALLKFRVQKVVPLASCCILEQINLSCLFLSVDWIHFPNRSWKERNVKARARVSQTNSTVMKVAYKPTTTSKREKETESNENLKSPKMTKKMPKSRVIAKIRQPIKYETSVRNC